MSDLLIAARQALQALEWNYNTDLDNIPACEQWAKMLKENITALRQAIEQAEQQEPVAWKDKTYGNLHHYDYGNSIPLYTTPPQRKSEREPVATKQMLRWVEHLKRLSDDGQHVSIPGLSSGACWELAIELEQFIKNTTPPQRKPLTDEEVDRVPWVHLSNTSFAEQLRCFARAIERAHGIGGGE